MASRMGLAFCKPLLHQHFLLIGPATGTVSGCLLVTQVIVGNGRIIAEGPADPENRPSAGGVFGPRVPAMARGDAGHGGQAQPGAPFLGRLEGREKVLPDFFLDARSRCR